MPWQAMYPGRSIAEAMLIAALLTATIAGLLAGFLRRKLQ